MTVFVLIPVFNRLPHTKSVINRLRQQSFKDLQIVVIDDGSTDGTSKYLASLSDLTVFRGDGNLWWAGAIDLALKRLLPSLSNDDYFLFVNNDMTFGDDFVETLVLMSRMMGEGIVGGVLRDESPPHDLLSVGPVIDEWGMRVWDKLDEPGCREYLEQHGFIRVDALPGRGALYPSRVFRRVGTMRPWLLPHYHADYEISARARRAGFPIVASVKAVVYSQREFGNDSSRFGWWPRYFSKRSASSIPHKLFFYMLIGSSFQRLTVILRFAIYSAERSIRGIARKWFTKGNS